MDTQKPKSSSSTSSPNKFHKSENDDKVTIRINRRVGQGGLWGGADFWEAIVENLVASLIFAAGSGAIFALAKKIHTTLKRSKAAQNELESCRFDLIIPAQYESWIVVRVMQSARFRTSSTIEQGDISAAIGQAVEKYKSSRKKHSNVPIVVIAELSNAGNEIRIRLNEHNGIESVPTLVDQIDRAKRGKQLRVKTK